MSVSQKFSEKKTSFWILFLRNYYLMILYFLCVAQSEKTSGRFQVEAPRAYLCKQILGLYQAKESIKDHSIPETDMKHLQVLQSMTTM